MSRSSMTLALTLLLPAALPAQRLAWSANDQPAGASGWTTDPSFQAFRWQAPRPMAIVACEFWYGSTQGTGTVMVFDHDAANDRPGALLGQGSFPAPAAACWTGARLDKPVLAVQPGQMFWLGWGNSNGVRSPLVGQSAAAPTYFWTKSLAAPITWNGPFGPPTRPTGLDWMYRVYEAGGTGQTAVYGQGKSGTYGAPFFQLHGWANVGNPISLLAAKLKDSSAGVLVCGRRTAIPLPLGTIYAFPPLIALGAGTASGASAQSLLFPFVIPGDPALRGLSVAWQLWLLDPGAADGLVHSDGAEAVIG